MIDIVKPYRKKVAGTKTIQKSIMVPLPLWQAYKDYAAYRTKVDGKPVPIARIVSAHAMKDKEFKKFYLRAKEYSDETNKGVQKVHDGAPQTPRASEVIIDVHPRQDVSGEASDI